MKDEEIDTNYKNLISLRDSQQRRIAYYKKQLKEKDAHLEDMKLFNAGKYVSKRKDVESIEGESAIELYNHLKGVFNIIYSWLPKHKINRKEVML